MPDIDYIVEEVRRAKRAVSDEGRPEAVESQHEHGKLTARERVDHLCSDFDEIGQLAAPAPPTPETAGWDREDAPADGVVAGVGDLHGDGRPIAVAATDFTVKGGSIGHTGWVKRALDRYDEPSEESWPPKKHAVNPW